MKKLYIFLFIGMIMLNWQVVSSAERFPTSRIKGIPVVELKPNESVLFEDYVKKNLNK